MARSTSVLFKAWDWLRPLGDQVEVRDGEENPLGRLSRRSHKEGESGEPRDPKAKERRGLRKEGGRQL